MFRTHMNLDQGMLFDFGRPQFVSFWMKNTLIALDMIFIRADGTISSVVAHAAPLSLEAIPAMELVRAVVEINAGRARALGIEPGEKVQAREFEHGRTSEH